DTAAILFSRASRLYYANKDPKGGAVDNVVRFYGQPTCHHAPEVSSGFTEVQSADLLRRFFSHMREAP
ncbi:nucleoside deaminase, partial [Rhizobium leguminosarum]